MSRDTHTDHNAPSDRLVNEPRAAQLKQEAMHLRSLTLTDRQICEIELILSGACAPLQGYMSQQDYHCVLRSLHLSDGTFFPMPMTLDLEPALAASIQPGERLVLRDDEGAILALLSVTDIWERDRQDEPRTPDDTETNEAEGVSSASERIHAVSGPLEGIRLPVHQDYPDLRLTPKALRAELSASKTQRVILVDTTANIPPSYHHRIAAIARELDATVLLHPATDGLQPTDLELHRRIKRERARLAQYPPGQARLALLPLVTHAPGVRSLLWRAMIGRNYGATHFFADPGRLGLGEDQAGSELLRRIAAEHGPELGLELSPIGDLHTPADDLAQTHAIPPALNAGIASDPDALPDARHEPAANTRGVTCFFTGLSGAGKSTIARALAARLSKLGRTVTLLDGDLVRRHLSSELSFSKEHRDLNIRRIGYVASEITRHGGIAICAPIAPYRVTRATVRGMIEAVGGFLEIHVATPLEICEQRDPKGLYAKAHAGLIKDFTGINDPYETPEHPELVLDTSSLPPDAAVERILGELRARGHLSEMDSEHDQGLAQLRMVAHQD